MKNYTKPMLNEEVIDLEDIIAVSYAVTGGDSDTKSWDNMFA